MRNFNKSLTCTKCGSVDQVQRFVDLEGQGVKCVDCMHKKYTYKPAKGATKADKRQGIVEGWDKMKKRSSF